MMQHKWDHGAAVRSLEMDRFDGRRCGSCMAHRRASLRVQQWDAHHIIRRPSMEAPSLNHSSLINSSTGKEREIAVLFTGLIKRQRLPDRGRAHSALLDGKVTFMPPKLDPAGWRQQERDDDHRGQLPLLLLLPAHTLSAAPSAQ
jgi:hypothetical protein